MAGLLRALRVLGPSHLWKLNKAQILRTSVGPVFPPNSSRLFSVWFF
jgi:hypothetical protein